MPFGVVATKTRGAEKGRGGGEEADPEGKSGFSPPGKGKRVSSPGDMGGAWDDLLRARAPSPPEGGAGKAPETGEARTPAAPPLRGAPRAGGLEVPPTFAPPRPPPGVWGKGELWGFPPFGKK